MAKIKCAYCGKPGQAKPDEIARGNGKYCSKSCSATVNGVTMRPQAFKRSPIRNIDKPEKEYGWD